MWLCLDSDSIPCSGWPRCPHVCHPRAPPKGHPHTLPSASLSTILQSPSFQAPLVPGPSAGLLSWEMYISTSACFSIGTTWTTDCGWELRLLHRFPPAAFSGLWVRAVILPQLTSVNRKQSGPAVNQARVFVFGPRQQMAWQRQARAAGPSATRWGPTFQGHIGWSPTRVCSTKSSKMLAAL